MIYCTKCGSKLLLGSVFIEEIEPDQEPYESDKIEDKDNIVINDTFFIHYCEKCGNIQTLWRGEL